MLGVEFRVKEFEKHTLVHFELDGAITPDVLRELVPPKVNPAKGVVLSGRGPVWLYCFLTHVYHPTRFVATYDPRIGGVVVESHDPDYKIGDVVKVNVEGNVEE